MSSNSNIPDLEIHESGYPLRPNSGASLGKTSSSQPQLHHEPTDHSLNIQPHPEIVQKKKEVLQELAEQKQAVKEAKVWVQVLLLFILCLTVLVYLHSEK